MLAACRILVAASLLATIASTLSVYPHSLAYFNELAGGPENGYKHLLGSNLDWGQDVLFLRKWMQEKGYSAHEVSFHANYAVTFISMQSEGGRKCRWNIVSANKLVELDSPWLGRMRDESACRVGSSLWAFPVENTHALRSQ